MAEGGHVDAVGQAEEASRARHYDEADISLLRARSGIEEQVSATTAAAVRGMSRLQRLADVAGKATGDDARGWQPRDYNPPRRRRGRG